MAENTKNNGDDNPDKYIPDSSYSSNKYKKSGDREQTNNDNEDKPEDSRQEPKNKKWSIADSINFAMAIFTAGLFAVTTYSTCLTRQAIISSDSTNSKYLDNIQRIVNSFDTSANNSKKALTLAKQSLDTTVYLNKKSFELQQKMVNSQINSLKETQKEFEVENRPFVQIYDIKIDTSGYKALLSFKIINYGKFPADVLYVKYRIAMALSSDENKKAYLKWQTRDLNIYVASGVNYLPEFSYMRTSSKNSIQKAIKDGEIIVYLEVEIKYTTYGTKLSFLHTSTNKIKYGVSDSTISNDDVKIR